MKQIIISSFAACAVALVFIVSLIAYDILDRFLIGWFSCLIYIITYTWILKRLRND